MAGEDPNPSVLYGYLIILVLFAQVPFTEQV